MLCARWLAPTSLLLGNQELSHGVLAALLASIGVVYQIEKGNDNSTANRAGDGADGYIAKKARSDLMTTATVVAGSSLSKASSAHV